MELGVKPVATFYHMPGKSEKHGPYIQYGWSSGAIAPAYGVAELGQMTEGHERRIELQSNGRYLILEKGLPGAFFYAQPTEAQARAVLLIFLLSNRKVQLSSDWRQDPNDPCADGRCKLPYSKDMEEIQLMPVPSIEDLKDPRFSAMWEVMKTWSVHAPEYYKGYREANGRHVKLLLDAQKEVMNESNPIPGTIGSDH